MSPGCLMHQSSQLNEPCEAGCNAVQRYISFEQEVSMMEDALFVLGNSGMMKELWHKYLRQK